MADYCIAGAIVAWGWNDEDQKYIRERHGDELPEELAGHLVNYSRRVCRALYKLR
jgi:hypothetical protein